MENEVSKLIGRFLEISKKKNDDYEEYSTSVKSDVEPQMDIALEFWYDFCEIVVTIYCHASVYDAEKFIVELPSGETLYYNHYSTNTVNIRNIDTNGYDILFFVVFEKEYEEKQAKERLNIKYKNCVVNNYMLSDNSVEGCEFYER